METFHTAEEDESFSFSSHELNYSSLKFLSDDDDDDESYIEIDLDGMRHLDEVELRISFSSLPTAELTSQVASNSILCESEVVNVHSFKFPVLSTSSSSMSTLLESTSPMSGKSGGLSGWGINSNGSPPTINVKGKVSPSDLRELQKIYGRNESRRSKNRELIKSRNSLKRSIINGGVMKLLIKFRSGRILSTFISLFKSNRFSPAQLFKASNQLNQETLWKPPKLSNPFRKWLTLMNNTFLNDDDKVHDDDDKYFGRGKSWTSEIASMDNIRLRSLDAVEIPMNPQIIESSVGSLSSFKSCSISKKFSRKKMCINDERNSGVCEAIAHCKRSLGSSGGYFR